MQICNEITANGPIRVTATTGTPTIVGYQYVAKYVHGSPIAIRLPIFG